MKSERIADVVGPVLAERGLELDDIEIVPAGKRSIVRIIVDGDGPKGRGPLLDEIASATRAISAALDESDATGQAPYTLEVTSRGISRPFTKPQHWRRNIGRLVKVRVADETIVGRIIAADETGATIDIEGNQRRIEYVDSKKPVVQVELNRPVDPDLDDVSDVDDDADSIEDEEE